MIFKEVFSGAKTVISTLRTLRVVHKMCRRYYRVTIVGGASEIGQSLALLLKLNPMVTELTLFDTDRAVTGLALDISQIDTLSKVRCFTEEGLKSAVDEVDLVLVVAGQVLAENQRRHILFEHNAKMVFQVAEATAKYAPRAVLATTTAPLNSIVPMAADVYERTGRDPYSVVGITTLDVTRATQVVAEINSLKTHDATVPVIGGHERETIIPVFSQSRPSVKIASASKIVEITKKIQGATDALIKLKKKDATMSAAYATSRFTDLLLKGLSGRKGIIQCAYVKSDVTEAPYFANPILFGTNGVEKNLGHGFLSGYELELLETAIPILCKQAKEGERFTKYELGYV